MPEFVAVFKAMANLRMLMCMIVAWVMGIGIGLIFTFLFWHLQVRYRVTHFKKARNSHAFFRTLEALLPFLALLQSSTTCPKCSPIFTASKSLVK